MRILEELKAIAVAREEDHAKESTGVNHGRLRGVSATGSVCGEYEGTFVRDSNRTRDHAFIRRVDDQAFVSVNGNAPVTCTDELRNRP